MFAGCKALGLLIFLSAAGAYSCQQSLTVDGSLWPVVSGAPAVLKGENLAFLGEGGTSKVYRAMGADSKPFILKNYFLAHVRDQDHAALSVWKAIQKRLGLDFLEIVEGEKVGNLQMKFPDVRALDLDLALKDPKISDATKKLLRDRYSLLKLRLQQLIKGELPPPLENGRIPGIAWEYEEGGTGKQDYFVMNYADFRFGGMNECSIMLKTPNVLVTEELKLVIMDPN